MTSKFLRVNIIIAAIIILLVIPVTTTTVYAVKSDKGLEIHLLTKEVGKINQGEAKWFEIQFANSGSSPAYDFRVCLLDADGLIYRYPGDGDCTSLSQDSTLDPREKDYVAVWLMAFLPTEKEKRNLTLESTYMDESGKVFSEDFSVSIQVEKAEKPKIKILTKDLGVIGPTQTVWVSLGFGNVGRTIAYDFKVVVVDSDGLGYVYPGNRDFTSLYRDANLEPGETDYASIQITAPQDVQMGMHKMTFELTYMDWTGKVYSENFHLNIAVK